MKKNHLFQCDLCSFVCTDEFYADLHTKFTHSGVDSAALKTHLMKFVCSYIDSVKFCRRNQFNQSRPSRVLRPRRKRTRYAQFDGSDSENSEEFPATEIEVVEVESDETEDYSVHPTEIQLLEEGPPPVKTEPPDSYNEQPLSPPTSSAFSNLNKHSLGYYRPFQRIAPAEPISNADHDSILPENLAAQGATIKMAVTKIKEDPDKYTVREKWKVFPGIMAGLVAEESQNGPRKMKKKTQILRDIIRPLTPEFEVESDAECYRYLRDEIGIGHMAIYHKSQAPSLRSITALFPFKCDLCPLGFPTEHALWIHDSAEVQKCSKNKIIRCIPNKKLENMTKIWKMKWTRQIKGEDISKLSFASRSVDLERFSKSKDDPDYVLWNYFSRVRRNGTLLPVVIHHEKDCFESICWRGNKMMLFDHLRSCRFTNTEVPSVFKHLSDELSLETRQNFQDELDLNNYHNPYSLEEERKIIINFSLGGVGKGKVQKCTRTIQSRTSRIFSKKILGEIIYGDQNYFEDGESEMLQLTNGDESSERLEINNSEELSEEKNVASPTASTSILTTSLPKTQQTAPEKSICRELITS